MNQAASSPPRLLFPAPAIAGAPRITQTMLREAQVWMKFARAVGARFPVEAKAQSALRFSAEGHAKGFALPSKLEGTSRFQPNIELAAGCLDPQSRKLRLRALEDGRVAARFGMYTLGYLRRKHACWAHPLAENGYLCCYLTRVTGGTPDKPTRGVNVCLYNLAEAVQMLTPHMEPSLFARLVGD